MNSRWTSIRMGCSRCNFRIKETQIWWLLKIIYRIFYNKIKEQICHICRTPGMWPIHYNCKNHTPKTLLNIWDRTSSITSSPRCTLFQLRPNHRLQDKWSRATIHLIEQTSQSTSFLETRTLYNEIINQTLLTTVNNNHRPLRCRIDNKATWIDNIIESRSMTRTKKVTFP